MKFKRYMLLHEGIRKLDLLNIKSAEIDHDLLADIIKENPGFWLTFGEESVRDILRLARDEAELMTARQFARCKVFIFDLEKALYFKFFVPVSSKTYVYLKATNPTGQVAKINRIEDDELEKALSKPHIDLNRIIGSKFDTQT